MNYNPAILEAARAHLGLTEWPGAKHNPAIVAMFADVGQSWVRDDETPWCAAFVGSVLASIGLPHTGKLNARSYLDYGQEVTPDRVMPGDIVVLWRGSRTSWQGHVGFVSRVDGNRVLILGGNQGNAVTETWYGLDRVLGYRRADNVTARGNRPVLRSGDRGAWVLDAQQQLTALGYTLGKLDAIFGPRMLGAVNAFQADNGIPADGIIGPRTWAALATAEHRDKRQVTMEDLKESRTVKAADEGKGVAAVTVGIGAAGAAVGAAEEAYDVAQRAGGLVQAIGAAWPFLLILAALGVGGYLIWRRFNRIKAIRLDDAQTGANDAR
jgi:uncharacterized protein (TIGR02594 family)